ncbi:chemotaxis response regulator protein-glutamate methylesterase [Geobacter sp. AOG2]|uniref:protein-glutamate methylesterase/protein-glutamine glutaminase n=1 Tax=Geobacter sp. AOG2 TaxID=1566347 RepID=UPI001CC660AC|nr:chemotaxis response regulator protein-glutamate methylesterase [Geobacter sp. AOG2]GFE61268.1 chemotaxis response regulator protein-glutamatemethylesterase of group 3 operon [Geobacter sp. AOG2]
MKKLKVLVVDDSAFSRRTITRMLEGLDCVEVIGYATNGEEGIHKVATLKPDLVTLDLEMPKMDGFTLLRILTVRYSTPVIVVSALNSADKVFKALELGALDFVAKPSSGASNDLLLIREDLQQKVLQIVSLEPQRFKQPHLQPPERGHDAPRGAAVMPAGQSPFDLVAIGASTGGPPALQFFFSAFERSYPFAMVVAQHMPSGFTHAFAERLNRVSKFDIKEAEDGDLVLPGKVLIAPGGMNLVLELQDGRVAARVVPPTSADRYVPSVDVMLESCAAVYRKRMIAVILTGMGNDGTKGVRSVKDAGGFVIAESDETAVVYGMPREAVATGLVDRIAPMQLVHREILAKGAFS